MLPLEQAALHQPEQVLTELPAQVRAAAGNSRQLALLALVEANACRVLARWECWQQAAERARDHARKIGDIALEARGLIGAARARIHQGDFYLGELQLAEAEKILLGTAHVALLADVQLGYSALSHRLGRHQIAADYAARGLATLGNADAALRVRLQRNLSRALAALERWDAAKTALVDARQTVESLNDPKLLAEIALEEARIARRVGDIETQRQAALQIRQLANELQNSQLRGLGDELQGYLAEQLETPGAALQHFRDAAHNFQRLNLGSDEIRVIDEYLRLALNQPDLSAWVQRRLELSASVNAIEKARSAEVFEERLRYAEQELAYFKLQSQAALLESERAVYLLLILLGLLIVMLLVSLSLMQRHSNQRLRQALQARQRAMLQTSHEMRNSLVAIRGLSERLVSEAPRAAFGEMLRTIMRGADHLAALAQDLLDQGRLEAGQLRLLPRPTNIHERLQQIHRLHLPLAREKGLTLILEEPPAELPALNIDPTRLEQVLTNLLANALKFSRRGRVVLSATQQPAPAGYRILFSVTDSGPGIPDAEIGQLFQPFSQTSVGKQYASGAGLGLSISRDLVALMGGTLQVQNIRNPGSSEGHAAEPIGCRFSFELQLDSAASPVTPIELEPARANPLRVLMVDDDPVILAIHGGMLQHLGVTPVPYATIDEVVAAGTLASADLLLLDCELNDGRSTDQIPQIRRTAGAELRIVVLSGHPAPAELPTGVDEWVQKPATTSRFAMLLAAASRHDAARADESTEACRPDYTRAP
ncbi:MAG: HAMP domain-containing histidine kinase [Xanthomonadales bacterium]|jgi:signal transduction histidine kinase/ActR/RegA family two-component response regulator|nr:HAMP domain-containing histidine kinase [Xanthomonadales bacterium]